MRDELLSLMPKTAFSRRTFVMTSVTAGFTLAAGGAIAQTAITTDTNSLDVDEAMIPAPGGEMPAYWARPSSAGPFPVILVVQEIFGVHEHIKDICRRLAKIGYFAIAPELYARQGDMSKVTDVAGAIAIARQVPDAQVMSDLDAVAAWAKRNRGHTDKLGITGFCWGGRIVWLYAAHNPNLGAGVAWYGRLEGQSSELNPKHPIDIAPELRVPVLGLYGGADQGIPPDSVERMRQALGTQSKSQIVVYPDAPHAFNADYRASYRPEAAKDGWRRMQAWFKQHGVA